MIVVSWMLLSGVAAAAGYTHFEARQTHPIALSPDGTRLFALNSTDGRLSVFDITTTGNPKPVLIAEIPVGVEPVSVRPRTNDEVWVVNEVSDSVSIVSISRGVVIDTLRASDEPADVVFANGKAFVSCARNNMVRVFDATTRAQLATIPLQGLYPRALVANAAGTRIYAAFQLSGNRTTVLPASKAPAPPSPTNPSLPPAPQTGLIVAASDTRIKYSVIDNDIAEIDTANHGVLRYFTNVGTNLFDIALRPSGTELWVPNTEARNLVRFEPVLRGHAVDNRVSRITLSSGSVTSFDLHPSLDYSALPNPSAQAIALAQPSAVIFNPTGTEMWVAAFGSDRVAKLSTSGAVLTRVDVRIPPSGGGDNGARRMRGPRGLTLDVTHSRLYVLNKLSNTISVIDTAADAVVAEVPTGSYDPMPVSVKEGRGFLFDARLSGNGTMSCATCHLDADRDGIAWDLGDPGGQMSTVMGLNNAVHDPTPIERQMHPMKGPMVTQTVRGIAGGTPLHWRGDRARAQDFNPAFASLLGGSQLATADIDAMAEYLDTIVHHPNPNRNIDNTLPASFAGGNPIFGRQKFLKHDNHCTFCHADPRGTDNNIDDRRLVGSNDNLKNPPLQTTYQRNFFNPTTGATSLSGFGMNHDGTGSVLPTVHFYELDLLAGTDFADVAAFVLCFDSGTFPAVGYSRTVNSGSSTLATVANDISLLEGQAVLGRNALVVQGVIGGATRSFHYDAVTRRYRSDRASEAPLTRTELLALIGSADSVTFSGALPGDSSRLGGDRDGNGILDMDEPTPRINMSRINNGVRVSWSRPANGWLMEVAPSLTSSWQQIIKPPQELPADLYHDIDLNGATSSFFRLRRTW
ncbi:hypothetical protein ACXR0O_14955 [Verrucomicrobiota bacterium sgz303538]